MDRWFKERRWRNRSKNRGEKRNRKEKKQNNGETFTQGSSGEALGEIVSGGGAPTPPQLPCSAWA